MGRTSLLLLLVLLRAGTAISQTTTFTYQGQLTNGGQLASGSFDLQFGLFDSVSGGTQIGSTQTLATVPVSGGVFTVPLDFGVSAFPGANRFLEIGVRPAGGGSYTTLVPRQQISSTPYAIRTLSAATADALSSACVGCVTDAQIGSVAGSKVSGTIPAASVPTGSGNYIQNTTAQQASSNFNIAGNGVVGGNLTVGGTLNANGGGNFIQNSTTPQAGANFNIGGKGTVGSLDVTGALTQGGTVAPATAPIGQGRIYFDSTTNKVKVSESGAPFVNLVGASGLSGSGTTNTIPLWSAGTTLGNSLITQSGGAVLLPNNVSLAAGVQGNQVGFGSPNSETGMTISGASGRADLRFDGLAIRLLAGPGGIPASTNGITVTTGGSVLVGSAAPQVGQFNVVSSLPGTVAIYGESSTNRAIYGKNTGSSRGVYGESLSGEGVFGISTNNHGVSGTTAAAGPLAGVIGASTASAGIGVFGQANSGSNSVGVYGKSTATLGQGVRGDGSAGGYGVYASNPSGTALVVDGNALQSRDKGGLVKAMAYIDADGSILRCFNAFLVNGPVGTCGFVVTTGGPSLAGHYYIDFHFPVSDRFVSATARSSGGNVNVGVSFEIFGTTLVEFITYIPDQSYFSSFADNPFMIIIY